MKRIIVLTVIALVYTLIGCGGSSETTKEKPDTKPTVAPKPKVEKEPQKPKVKPDFRNAVWGMTRQQVKSGEKLATIQEPENGLIYKETLLGMDTLLFYLFNKNGLYRAAYIFTHKHTNKTEYILDYRKVKETLERKYGKAKEGGVQWRNDLYKDNFQDWGLAVSLGHLVFLNIWETERSTIYLSLKGDNYKISFALQFDSKVVKEEKEDESGKL